MHQERTHLYLTVLLLTISLLPAPTLIQGQTPISGVVNQYAKVLGTGTCPNILRVDDSSGFTAGQRVLLLSMQGREMVESNDSDFGLIPGEALSAGLYDWTRIEMIQGNEITLVRTISEGYDFSRSVQLVGVPFYEEAVVTGALVPLAWNGTVGGVLALEVAGTLTLEADLNATGYGFRGGLSVQAADDNCNLFTSAADYFYETGNWRAAAKGEGIVPFIPGKENGRGPQANGGGGANTHNTGGGGGSNRSLGGIGGENLEPSPLGCNGFFPGRGGLALELPPDRWLMGGGGGAGHRNNDGITSGGNGGGIILVKTGNLTFSNGRIQTDGENGGAGKGDGGGGGGAGGTIVLSVGAISGASSISARGGDGGNADNLNQNRCFGPGGGGSGGQVYSTVAVDPVLNGGDTGRSIKSDTCPEESNGALRGEVGDWTMTDLKGPSPAATLQILDLSQDTSICPGAALALSVSTGEIAFEVDYQWQINAANGWTLLPDDAVFQGTTTPNLQINSLDTDAEFRVILSTACTEPLTSSEIKISIDGVGANPTAGFDYEYAPDGFTVNFENTSQGALAFAWTINEIPSYNSTEPAPEITFPGYGTYQVSLQATNQCGVDSITQTIVVGLPPTAAFAGSFSGSNCVPLTIQWTDQSEGVYDNYQWEFPGGIPVTSQVPNPLVTYETPGVYEVRLTVTGPLGMSTRVREDAVEVFSVPQPEFSYQLENLTVRFTSSAQAGIEHIWSFGDGGTSREKNPVYTFSEPGVYDVTLNLQTRGCGRSITQTLVLAPTWVNEPEPLAFLRIGPNPTSGSLQLASDSPEVFPLQLSIFSSDGQLLGRHTLSRSGSVDLSPFAPGVYWLSMSSPLGTGSRRIIKQ